MPTVHVPQHRARAGSPRESPSHRKAAWIRATAVLALLLLLGAAWTWTPLRDFVDLHRLSDWIEPYRHAWYALPLVVAAYVVGGLFMISVLLMILATGLAFGPWLGSLYALAGCFASASVGFAIGRWAGIRRVEKLAGSRVQRIRRKLERNGTLAVFVIRKVPAPYMLANIVMGASTIRFRDYLLGTLLGMGPMVVALAGFGYQLTRAFDDPSPGSIAIAAAFLLVPLALAWGLNRALKRRMEPE